MKKFMIAMFLLTSLSLTACSGDKSYNTVKKEGVSVSVEDVVYKVLKNKLTIYDGGVIIREIFYYEIENIGKYSDDDFESLYSDKLKLGYRQDTHRLMSGGNGYIFYGTFIIEKVSEEIVYPLSK